jgi:hypothetical protein
MRQPFLIDKILKVFGNDQSNPSKVPAQKILFIRMNSKVCPVNILGIIGA